MSKVNTEFRNPLAQDIGLALDSLMTRYPTRNIVKIIADAGEFTRRNMSDMTNADVLTHLVRFFETHD